MLTAPAMTPGTDFESALTKKGLEQHLPELLAGEASVGGPGEQGCLKV